MNRNVRIKKKLNKSKINNSHLESFVSNPNKSFQNRSFTYQQQDEFEPGSWEWNSQYNNIYYSNQGGAVSVNTKNIQYFDPYSKYPELNPNLNGYKKQNSTFGSQVINANNGNLILVSDTSNSCIKLFNYKATSNTWEELEQNNTITGSNDSNSQFGYSMSMDYNVLVVGDPGLSSIYVYRFPQMNENNYSFVCDGSFNFFDYVDESNLGFSCAVSMRPNTGNDTSYCIISGSPNTNDVLWWDDGFINWKSNEDIYQNANEYNGSNSTEIQAGYSVDIQWKDHDLYYFAAGAPYRNSGGETDAGEIIVSLCNKTFNSVLQQGLVSKNLSINNFFGSQLSIDNCCNYLFVSSPGYETESEPEAEPEVNGMIEAYSLILDDNNSSFDITYKDTLKILQNKGTFGTDLQAYSLKDNNIKISFGAPDNKCAYLVDFKNGNFDYNQEQDKFVYPIDNNDDGSKDNMFGFSCYFSNFNNIVDEEIFTVSQLNIQDPKVFVFNNVGEYQFNVNGNSYISNNLYVQGELKGPHINQMEQYILTLQNQVNDLTNIILELQNKN